MSPPLGAAEAPAIVCSASFFIMSFICLYHLKATHLRLYIPMALAGILRGISMALRAHTIAAGSSTTDEAIVAQFFAAAGFGIVVAVGCLVLQCWFRNTVPPPKHASLWRKLCIALFPVVLAFGPIAGLAGVLLIHANGSADALAHAAKIFKASACGMLGVASINTLLAIGCTAWAVHSTGAFSPRGHEHQKVVVLVATNALLVWSAATRVATQFQHPDIAHHEELTYDLQTLPELLQLAAWCVPHLMAKVYLSSRYEEWRETGGPLKYAKGTEGDGTPGADEEVGGAPGPAVGARKVHPLPSADGAPKQQWTEDLLIKPAT